MIRVEGLLGTLQSLFLLTAFECRRTILLDSFQLVLGQNTFPNRRR